MYRNASAANAFRAPRGPRMNINAMNAAPINADIPGAISEGLDLRKKISDAETERRAKEFADQHGPALLNGDKTAIAELAKIDPSMATIFADRADTKARTNVMRAREDEKYVQANEDRTREISRGDVLWAERGEDRKRNLARDEIRWGDERSDKALSDARDAVIWGDKREDRTYLLSERDRSNRLSNADEARVERADTIERMGYIASAIYSVKTPEEYQDTEDWLVEAGIMSENEAGRFNFDNMGELVSMVEGVEAQIEREDEALVRLYDEAGQAAERELAKRRVDLSERQVAMAEEKQRREAEIAERDRAYFEDLQSDDRDSFLPTLEEGANFSDATGFTGAYQSLVNTMFDWAGLGLQFPEGSRAREHLRKTMQTAASTMQNAVPGRPNVKLMEDIKATLPRLGIFYDGQGTTLDKIDAQMVAIDTALRYNAEDLRRPNLTDGDRSKIQQAISDLSALRTDFQHISKEIQRGGETRSAGNPKAANTTRMQVGEDGAPVAPSGMAEGTRVRSKTNGRIYIMRNGKLVPEGG